MSDEFAEPAPDEAPPRRRRGLLATVTVLVVFAAFGTGLWYAYKEGLRRGSESVAPIIAAADGPIKVRPQSPGGMEVPYRDTLVYDKLSPGPVKEPEANLQPGPEEPIIMRRPKPMPGAEFSGDAPPPSPPAATSGPNLATPVAPGNLPPPPQPTPQPPPEPIPQAAPESTPKPPPSEPSAPASTARYRLQLSSVRSAAAATETWDSLVAKNGDVVGSLKLTIQKIDLGEGKGVYYRVQAGPVASEADGNRMCATLRQRKAACIVVRH